MLHLSDLHFSSERDAISCAAQLREDLFQELGRPRLTAVVLSGDLTNRATPEEFAAARVFVDEVSRDFDLTPRQVIIVPGNHDLAWESSRSSYRRHRKSDLPVMPRKGEYFDDGDHIEVVDDQDAYHARFAAFSDFYQSVRGEPYPLDPDRQATIHAFEDAKLLLVGLNSAWQIDHRFTGRADIHSIALGKALREIDYEPRYAEFVKIAVWHHPVQGPDEDRIKDTGCMERLAQAGFRLALHGHIHRADLSRHRYDETLGGRGIDLLGAGTFGATTPEMRPGYPLQYQLLEFKGRTLRMYTRRREERNGAWKPDARWLQGVGQPPRPWYEIDL